MRDFPPDAGTQTGLVLPPECQKAAPVTMEIIKQSRDAPTHQHSTESLSSPRLILQTSFTYMILLHM